MPSTKSPNDAQERVPQAHPPLTQPLPRGIDQLEYEGGKNSVSHSSPIINNQPQSRNNKKKKKNDYNGPCVIYLSREDESRAPDVQFISRGDKDSLGPRNAYGDPYSSLSGDNDAADDTNNPLKIVLCLFHLIY